MKPGSYRERDQAFGQRMLTLRFALEMTQTELAGALGVSRHAVSAWEAGNSYPKISHLKHVIALSLQRRALPKGREAEEIRALWHAAQQKVELEEQWLGELLDQYLSSTVSGPLATSSPSDNNPLSKGETTEEGRRRAQQQRRPSTSEKRTLERLEQPAFRAQKNAPDPVATHYHPPAHMPFQATSFVGRAEELDKITSLLANPACRLLTLLGPGGIGKTRLALQVASTQTKAFADGVVFVALESVDTPQQMVATISDALGLSFTSLPSPMSQLVNELRALHMLLVLDNFEHLLSAVDLVSHLLAHAPRVTILVTSRERLNIRPEWLFDVGGLAYPPEHAIEHAPVPLADYSAVQLFVQRAAQIQVGLGQHEAELQTVARICRQVVGMPLAVELAAATTRALPLIEIERQIYEHVDILASRLRDMPSRHRSLRAVFDHSWKLLDDHERTIFSRLAVFRGGWTADAAQHVAGATLPTLIALVDKSLVRFTNSAAEGSVTEGRFTLLEPLREYALEQLAGRGEAEAILQAHASYYQTLAETLAAQWDVGPLETVVAQFKREHDNMRAALSWARDTRHATIGLRLAEALWLFWRSYSYTTEGRTWLEQLLAIEPAPSDVNKRAARQRGLRAAAWLASDQHQYARAAELLAESLTLRRSLGDNSGDADLLVIAARRARMEGDYASSTALFEQALAWHRSQGHHIGKGNVQLEPAVQTFTQTLRETGLVMREQGYFVRATLLFEESLAFHRQAEDPLGVGMVLIGLADVARDQGQAGPLREHAEQALVIFRELGVAWATGFTLNTLALGAYYEGNLELAASLIGESEALFRKMQAYGSLTEILVTVGKIEHARGNTATAHAAITEALRKAHATGPRLFVAASQEGLANILAEQGHVEQSARLLASASALRQHMGTPVWPADQPRLEATLATVRSALGDHAFTTTWNEIHALPIEQLLDLTRVLVDELSR